MDFNEKFINLSSEKNKQKKLLSKLLSIEEEIDRTEKNYTDLKKKLSKEEKDVTKLESLTLNSIYYKMRGTIDEKLSKEKFEFLEAKAKSLECYDYLKRLYLNRDNLNNEIESLGDLDLKHSNLLKESADYILNLNNEKTPIISEISNKINLLKLENKELSEAINEGNKLIPVIEDAISNLKSAQNWGIYDMMGGDFIATMAKRSKMNEASNSLNSIKILLNNYNSELQDLNKEASISLDINGLSSFMDYFFDNFFTDYFVQNKIDSALNSTINFKKEIIKIQSNLENNLNSNISFLEKLLEDLEKEIRK